jgi:microcystin-dependent protein
MAVDPAIVALRSDLAIYAKLDSPSFTGDPKATTPPLADNDTSIATTAFVRGEILSAAPVLTSYAPLNSPLFTGDPKAPTPATGDNDTSIATTAFVKAQGYALASDITGFAPIASPTFTGDPKAPTPVSTDNDTSIATTAFVTAAVSAATSGGIPPGAIMDFAGSAAPTGWYVCDGSLKNRTTDAALFTAIGTIYGAGDGSTTFAIPDCRGRVRAGVDGGANRLQTTVGTALGATGGVQNYALVTAEMPAHAHAFQGDNFRGVGEGSYGSVQSGTGSIIYYANSTASFTGGTVGGGGAHQNTQPTIMMNTIIKR